MKIIGLEGMTTDEINFELQRGGKFVLFQYCVSVLVVTFKRASAIYFLKSGENAIVKGLRFTAISLIAGWWGFPWGPIYTVRSLFVNLRGGKDITAEIITATQLAKG
ncbi:MAG: hypothetical protein WAN10_04225 [Candidatus Acidiferrales bacterium]